MKRFITRHLLAGKNQERRKPLVIRGAAGGLKSLHLLMKTRPDRMKGYVFSCAPYAELPEQGPVFRPLDCAYVSGHASWQNPPQ